MKTKVLPVIHHLDTVTTLIQAAICHDAGADGVFLISHDNRNVELPPLVKQIRADFPGLLVGLNLLGYPTSLSLGMAIGAQADMLWLDDAGITSNGMDSRAEFLRDIRERLGDRCPEIFASVAFKYQKPERDPRGAARRAAQLGFIPTTSGPGTGKAPSVDKIKAMHGAGPALAIASGMTPENVAEFVPYVSHILVATGVSSDEHHFDYEQMCRFVSKVRLIEDVGF